MAANAALMNIQAGRNVRTYRASHAYRQMNDRELRERYRFGRESIEYIVELLKRQLERPTARNRALSAEEQVLIALRFYATGNFLQTVGDTLGYDKYTVSRVLEDVTTALCGVQENFIIWPQSREQKETIKAGFFEKRGFPNVIGCIDGTHIRIQKPVLNKRAFQNRKHFPSLNVLAVCDHEGKFTFINAAWPGSNHDSLVFRLSVLSDFLEANNRDLEDGVILGDSGYASKRYMLTPYRHTQGRAQERYQVAHCGTRCTIERTFGQWKRRFGVLHGETKMSPTKTSNIVMACAVLHNISKNMNEPLLDGPDGGANQQQPGPEPYEGPEDGNAIRDYIARAYFA